MWASRWLEQLEENKSDATKADERSSLLRSSAKTRTSPTAIATVLLTLILLAGTLAAVWLW
jgi:hypothetical protein